MKIISWNVAGFRACLKKGFDDFFKEIDADIFCMQESKVLPEQFEYNPEGYYQYLNPAEKKGYSGTLVYTKVKPLNVTFGMGIEEHDHEGRIITMEFEKYYVITVYVPNVKRELTRLDYRMQWEDDFRKYLKKLEKNKPVIVCGDLNVALLALIGEGLGASAEVSVVDGLQPFLPHGRQFLQPPVGERTHIAFCQRVQLVVHGQKAM